jgi:hypothetical protein
MEKLDKELIANIYSKLSVVIGLSIFIILLMYFSNLPELMYGPVEKGIFNLDFSVGYEMNLIVFNLPLIFFTLLFLYNLGMLIYTQTGNKMEANNITESMFYNTILSFLLIVSQIVYMVPDSINGIIEIGFFQFEFVELSDLSTKGINFGYILATIYTFYSTFVLFLETRQDKLDLE